MGAWISFFVGWAIIPISHDNTGHIKAIAECGGARNTSCHHKATVWQDYIKELSVGKNLSEQAWNVGNNPSLHRKCVYKTTVSAVGQSWTRKSVYKLWWMFTTNSLGNNFTVYLSLSNWAPLTIRACLQCVWWSDCSPFTHSLTHMLPEILLPLIVSLWRGPRSVSISLSSIFPSLLSQLLFQTSVHLRKSVCMLCYYDNWQWWAVVGVSAAAQLDFFFTQSVPAERRRPAHCFNEACTWTDRFVLLTMGPHVKAVHMHWMGAWFSCTHWMYKSERDVRMCGPSCNLTKYLKILLLCHVYEKPQLIIHWYTVMVWSSVWIMFNIREAKIHLAPSFPSYSFPSTGGKSCSSHPPQLALNMRVSNGKSHFINRYRHQILHPPLASSRSGLLSRMKTYWG